METFSLIILAAGKGARFGGNKLHAPLHKKPLVQHVLERVAAFSFRQKILVIRPQDKALHEWAACFGFHAVENPYAEDGMGTSLAIGVRTLFACDACFIALGDMPFITPDIYLILARAFEQYAPRYDIILPGYQGQRGHPVLFGRAYFPALAALEGDEGARNILSQNEHKIHMCAVDDKGILKDIDTVQDIERE